MFAANNVILTPPASEQELHEKQENSHQPLAGGTAKPPALDTVLSELIVLRGQHKQLTACFQSLLHLDGANRPLSPLSATAEEELDESLDQVANQPSPSVSQIFEHHRSPTRASRLSRRASTGTDTSIEWFDAVDGPEEFIIPPEPKDAEDQVVENGEDSDSDAEATADDLASEFMTSTGEQKKKQVQRRTILPTPITGDEMSLLAVLKKNVGKVCEYALDAIDVLILLQDLATTSLPVAFNEPISILQRLAEDLEYSSLLDQAAATNDPVERVSLIATFAISGYACTRIRAGRKPFNPMLGETFEDIRNNFIAEKVSHVPPVMACRASGQGWTYDAVTQPKQRVRLPSVAQPRLFSLTYNGFSSFGDGVWRSSQLDTPLFRLATRFIPGTAILSCGCMKNLNSPLQGQTIVVHAKHCGRHEIPRTCWNTLSQRKQPLSLQCRVQGGGYVGLPEYCHSIGFQSQRPS